MSRIPIFLSCMTLTLAAGCRRNADADLPAPYREMTVPSERLASEAGRSRGRELYLQYCALCHGENADGRGVRREGLSSFPRDFTDPQWRRRFSPRQVFWTLREGKRNTAMPAWGALGDEDLWDITAYVLSVARPVS
jgi:mono/diheme cytochrome c family protein